MPVLMADGRRKCDARCYNAKPASPCGCCCGGMNHAKGKQEAIENTRKHAHRLLENCHKARLAVKYEQMELEI